MDTAVIYARKSDPNATTDDESFENQEDTCRAYAREKGYSVFKVYREAHSGADLAGRPLIWQAIEDIKHGDAHVLLVRNWDRLARRTEHQGVILYEVEDKAHGRVEAALEPVDRQDPMANMTRTILAAVADGERVNAVARMERGKRRRAERGHLSASSHPLFGYAWLDDEPGKRTTYVIDTDTGLIVVRMFSLAKSGQSLRGIALLFNAEGVPTPSQWTEMKGHIGRHRVGSKWTGETVRRIIMDRTYTGEGAAYRWKRITSSTGGTGHAPTAEIARVKLTVPALVDLATFNAANAAIQTREQDGRPPIDREASWLRGHVYCGVCGRKMTLSRNTGRNPGQTYIYACRNRTGASNDGDDCPGGAFSVRSHRLDPHAYYALKLLAELPDLRERMIERLGLNKTQALATIAEGYEAQLTEKRQLLETARRRSLQTTDDELAAQFMRDAEALNKDIHSLESAYADARDQLVNFAAGTAWVDATLERIRAGLPSESPTEEDIRDLPYEEKRLLLASTGLYLKVYPRSYKNRVEIAFHFTDGTVTGSDAYLNRLHDGLTQLSRPSLRMLQLIISLDELCA